jgi:2-isopropylmalate synthase
MVRILDATLREGEQTPGVCFDPHIKLAVAQLLDEVGVDIIEGGHPAVAPEIKQVVKTLAAKDLRATVSAHSRSTESDLALALECGVGFLGIFYCVSDERLSGVHRKDLGTAVEHITRAIRYAKQKNPDLVVRYSPTRPAT